MYFSVDAAQVPPGDIGGNAYLAGLVVPDNLLRRIVGFQPRNCLHRHSGAGGGYYGQVGQASEVAAKPWEVSSLMSTLVIAGAHPADNLSVEGIGDCREYLARRQAVKGLPFPGLPPAATLIWCLSGNSLRF